MAEVNRASLVVLLLLARGSKVHGFLAALQSFCSIPDKYELENIINKHQIITRLTVFAVWSDC